jgi:adenine-specific DNA-methyltransferase
MEKLTAQSPETKSPDLVAENLAKLQALFPEAVTEDGVNVDALKQLIGKTVTDTEEKYGLNWHGKRQARQMALTPSTGTLRPCPEESVDWDKTQNLMIEGDNLEVLKLLQKSYAGKVKLIYIDPPYNTGKDFVYPDNFQDNIKNYLELTGQTGEEGKKLSSNTEASGRFHTDWLNMMYPRLKVARNLLRDDGIIFISIDDNEIDNTRKLCAEIFGEENICCQFVWNTEGNTDNQYLIKVNHEYILAYYKSIEHSEKAIGRVVDPNTPQESNLWKGVADNNINKNNPANPPAIVELPAGFPSSEKELTYPKKKVDDAFFKQTLADGYISDEVKAKYDIEHKSGLPIKLDDMIIKDFKLTKPCRIYVGMANRNKLLEFIKNKCNPILDEGTPLKFYLNVNAGVRYLRENDKPSNILSVLRGLGTTEKTKTYLKNMGIYYDYAKPVGLLEYLVKVGCEGNDIVMDFFAGSGTTAEAVLNLNSKEEAKRRFICVQLPDKIANQAGMKNGNATNLAEIAEKRIKTIIERIREKNPMFAGDLGFRVFKLASSNIQAWEPDRQHLAETLEASVDHLKTDRTESDILFELLLKLGLDLTVPIETRKIGQGEEVTRGQGDTAAKSPLRQVSSSHCQHTVHSIGAGTLLVCLSKSITAKEVEPLALGIAAWLKELAPTEADRKARNTVCVFRDSAFADDVAKTNLTAILQQHGLENVRSL